MSLVENNASRGVERSGVSGAMNNELGTACLVLQRKPTKINGEQGTIRGAGMILPRGSGICRGAWSDGLTKKRVNCRITYEYEMMDSVHKDVSHFQHDMRPPHICCQNHRAPALVRNERPLFPSPSWSSNHPRC